MKLLNRAILLSASAVFISAAVSGADDFTGSALWNHPNDLKTDGDYAYCAFANGLAILDIADPSSMALTSDLIITGRTTKIDVSGNYAFLIDKEFGLKIVNMMNRSYPFLIGTRQTPGQAADIFIAGQYAYIADVDSGLFVFDISNPYDVSLIGHSAGEYTTGIFVAGDYAYLTSAYGLLIYDVTDPENPFMRGGFMTYPVLPRGVFVIDTLAYLVTDPELLILDVSDKWSPALVGSWQAKTACTGIIVSDDYAYISERPYGLNVVNIADPQNPFLVGAYEQQVGWPRIAVDGETVYFIDAESDLLAIDVSDRSEPTVIGVYPAKFYVENVAVSGNRAFVVDGYFGIRVLDISDPAVPEIVGGWAKSDSIADISISGSYCYLIDESSQLEILDISDPLAPELTASISIPGTAKSIAVGESEAYIAAGPEGLQIIDISDPWNPAWLGNYETEHEADGVTLTGRYAALRTGYRRQILFIVISNPEDPIPGGVFECPSSINDFRLSDDILFVARDYSLYIFRIDDLRDPMSFDLLGVAGLERQTARLSFIGNLAFVSHPRSYWQEHTCEISVIDISDLSEPAFAGDISTPGFSHALDTNGGTLYIADGYSLLTLRVSDPTGVVDESPDPVTDFALLANYPNPFNARTTICYDHPRATEVRLEIYDILGRKLETLVRGFQPAGPHVVVWDAADNPSGIYFYRLRAGDYAETRSCLLVK
jgi:hypothetical protein